MPDVIVPSGARRMAIEATVIRADGTVEPLGVVHYWHRNPLIRVVMRAVHQVRRRMVERRISRKKRY